jgi:HSP20 family protein
MTKNELVPSDFWSGRLPSIWGDEFWSQLAGASSSGLSLSEDDTHVYVELAVPGLESKDITMSYHQGTLVVSGEHQQEETKKRHYRTMQSSFSYQVALPGQIKEEVDPKAALKNGLLTVTFEKLPLVKPRQIKIAG